jgi:hypothetical protein
MTQTIVALYDTVNAAERAVRDLHSAGVADRDISLMAADTHGEYGRSLKMKTEDSSATEKGAGLGAALGGLGGLLVGLGALTIPGIGPVVAAGPLATAVAALAGAGAGALAGGAAGGLLGALVDAGLPEEQAQVYAEGVRRGGTLLAVRVPDDLLEPARDILERHDPVDVEERASTWRQQGWTGYDTSAGPYTGERLGSGTAMTSGDAAMMGSAAAMTGGPQPLSSQPSQGLEPGAGQGSAAVFSRGSTASQDNRFGQPDKVVTSDYDRYAPAFRGHYQTNLAQSGFQYEHYEPAYQYGLTLGNYEPYRGLDWMQIEREARHAWEERNPNTWDRIRDAVRYGWERVRVPVR